MGKIQTELQAGTLPGSTENHPGPGPLAEMVFSKKILDLIKAFDLVFYYMITVGWRA